MTGLVVATTVARLWNGKKIEREIALRMTGAAPKISSAASIMETREDGPDVEVGSETATWVHIGWSGSGYEDPKEFYRKHGPEPVNADAVVVRFERELIAVRYADYVREDRA